MSSPPDPVDQLKDAFIYAPLALLLNADEHLPKLAEQGRNQINAAKIIGEMAVKMGSTRLGPLLNDVAAGFGLVVDDTIRPTKQDVDSPVTADGAGAEAESTPTAAAEKDTTAKASATTKTEKKATTKPAAKKPAAKKTPAKKKAAKQKAAKQKAGAKKATAKKRSSTAKAAAAKKPAKKKAAAKKPAVKKAAASKASATKTTAKGASAKRSSATTATKTATPTDASPAPTEPPAADALALTDFESLSASHVVPRLENLSPDELEGIRRFEIANRGRRTILNRIAQLQADS